MTMPTTAQWLKQKDDDPPRIKGRPKPIIEKRIRRIMGPYVINIVSSVGNRPTYADVNGHPRVVGWERKPGFVRVAVHDLTKCSIELTKPEHVDGYLGARKWQADNWVEADSEINELISALRHPTNEESEDKESILKQVELTLSALGITFRSG